jgi:signal transduction histidine kinase/ActR/RegA family two-component response regulator
MGQPGAPPDTESFRRALDLLPDPTLIVREDFVILYANPAAHQRWAAAAGDLVGQRCHGPVHGRGEPCEVGGGECPLRSALAAGATTRVEHQHIDADGSRHRVEVIGTPLETPRGELRAIVEFHRELSDTRRLELALAEISSGASEATGEAFFEHLVVQLAHALDAEHAFVGGLEGGDPDAMETWAMVLDGVLVTGDERDARSLEGTACQRVLEVGACVYPDNVHAAFPDDTWLSRVGARAYAGSPLKASDGSVLGALCVMSARPLRYVESTRTIVDVFAALASAELERRHMAQRRRELEEQLRHAQTQEVVGRLVAGVVHDFRNLLSPIRGFTELALQQLRGQEPLASDLQEVLDASVAAERLVEELLSVSRRQDATWQSLRLAATLEGLVPVVRQALREDFSLALRLGGRGLVHGDPHQLRQVLLNLVVNAREAMAPGGTLTIATRDLGAGDPLIAEHLEGELRPCVLWTVTDDGVGMAPDVRDRVFDAFFTTRGASGGTGLGLAVVHGVVKHHHGAIWVDSEPGRGATFSVLLPQRDAAHRPATDAGGAASERRCRGVVLVVEDQPAVRRLLGRMVRSCGAETLEPATCAEALALLEDAAQPIDLLLTDVVMPEMSGGEVARCADLARPGLPVLFVSGYPAGELDDIEIVAGQVEFLCKPIAARDLADKLGEMLPGQAALR